MEIYIMRHGETVWNTERRLQGGTDIELNENGIRLAQLTSEKMREINFDKIYSSPLKRAYMTADIIRAGRDIPIYKSSLIREISFGEWEGIRDTTLIERGCSFKYFFKAPDLYRAPKSGEDFEALCERGREFMSEVIEPEAAGCKRILIVAHGAINSALMMHIRSSNEIKDFWGEGLQKNCGINIINYDNSEYSISEYNKIFY